MALQLVHAVRAIGGEFRGSESKAARAKSMEVACHCAQVDSRPPLAGEESRRRASQLVAAQHTKG